MLIRARKFSMQFGGSALISLSGALWRLKKAKVNAFAVGIDHGAPPVAVLSSVNSLEASLVVPAYAFVPLVLRVTGWPDVLPSKAATIPGLVINLMWRPFAHHNEISQPVGEIGLPVDVYNSIAIAPQTSSYSADVCSRSSVKFPPNLADPWVVTQYRSHEFCCDVIAWFRATWHAVLSHSILPRSHWLGVCRGAASALTPRYFGMALHVGQY